ncbi:MAG: PH domain-containing protein [Aeromonas sp.]
MSEQSVWKGTPSQVVNFNKFIICILLSPLLGISLLYALWLWIVVKNVKYELTTERFITKTGVFNKKTDELELYRLKDYSLEEPFFLRMFSLANINLSASDVSHDHLKIYAIKDGHALRDLIRNNAEQCRRNKTRNVEVL